MNIRLLLSLLLVAANLLIASSALAQDTRIGRGRCFASELQGFLQSPQLGNYVRQNLSPNNETQPFQHSGASRRGSVENLPGAPTSFRALLPAQSRALQQYDISVLIDRSGSMAEKDCPSVYNRRALISRWDWCREQTTYLAGTVANFSRRITVVPFSNKPQRFERAAPADIHSIFAVTQPRGGTNLAAALKQELDQYFHDSGTGQRTRPLMIAVISDGLPNNRSAVKRVIKDATLRMNNPSQIVITFLQVGNDPGGSAFLQELDHDMSIHGAAFDIVRTRHFPELVRSGLPAALADSLSRRYY